MVDSVSTYTIAKKDIVLLRFENGKITVTDMSKKEVFKVNITNEQFSDEVSCGFWGHSDKQYIIKVILYFVILEKIFLQEHSI